MKFRSRIAAVAAATGLAAGLLIVGGGGTAQAQDTVLIDCDRVAGTAAIKPPLAPAAAVVSAAIKGPNAGGADPFKPAVTTRDCTGILATPGNGGTPDDVGPLTKVAGKLVGSASCLLGADPPVTDPLDPFDGKLTLTYTTLDAAFKPWASAAYIRVGTGADPAMSDRLDIESGIVTKGAGVGADVTGAFLFSPYSTAKVDHDSNPATPVQIRPDQSFIDGNGVIQAGTGSQIIGLQCQLGLGTLGTVFFGTDGESLQGGTLDSSIGIVLPA